MHFLIQMLVTSYFSFVKLSQMWSGVKSTLASPNTTKNHEKE